ncbi:sensor histidine kinase [Hymenobacter cellulosivorans]|uniref:histidine kinase n=1 Tax=Hymenobacter cellulosivorans TaxID=2932249 RepID=A0ABY4FGE0_9BACT|nr:HAMP domain-containing sensor histidine kinase [Hymenobacter cellulosivorans]UOQ55475.1 HAMP domain-containing histidine kinase [Hymenobacter cellulosivorans]
MKLLTRTTLIFLLYASVVAGAGTFVYYGLIHKLYYAYVDRTLSRRKLRVEKALRLYLHSPADLAYWHQLDHNVEFVPLPAPPPRRPDQLRERLMYNELTGKSQPYRQLSSAVLFQGRPYELQIRVSLFDTQQLLLRIVLAGAGLFGLLVLGLFGLQFVLNRRLWQPFYVLLEQLQRYKLNRNEPITLPATSIREFQQLQEAVQLLLRQNQHVYRQQKEFTENAAHEIQTPLAVLRTQLDLLVQAPGLTEEQAGYIEGIMGVTQRLTHLTKSLLLLAQLDNQLFFPAETVDVATILRTQLSHLQHLVATRRLTLETDIAASVPMQIHRGLLEVLVSNLLVNAIRHNIAQGHLLVRLTPEALTVENTGQEQSLQEAGLFSRFHKASDGSAEGVGLGLTLVLQICTNCGLPLRYSYVAPGRHRQQVLLH